MRKFGLQIVAIGILAAMSAHCALAQNFTVTLLNQSPSALGINSSGHACISGGYSYLWTPTTPNGTTGSLQSLPPLPPSGKNWQVYALPQAINASGAVVGYTLSVKIIDFFDSKRTYTANVWRNWQPVALPSGGSDSYAYGINSGGDAVDGSILRFDGRSGAYKGFFVPPGSAGLNSPQNIVFGEDCSMYVASGNWFSDHIFDFNPGAVLRFEGPDGRHPGAFLGTFIPGGYGGLANPCGMIFGPHGDLFVASCVLNDNLVGEPGTNQVLRYDGKTGAFKGVFVAPDSGGLNFPTFLTFTDTDPTTLNYGP